MRKIYVINGPNLNLLGIREPEKYGKESYEELLSMLEKHAEANGYELIAFQSNHEGDLVDKIHEAYFCKADGIVINPGAYTHTSVALLDAVLSVKIPTVEVHITDPLKREDFRHISYIRAACEKSVTGHGLVGYLEAVDFLLGRNLQK